MRVMGVDPGGTTGWAVWDDGEIAASGQSSFKDFVGVVIDWAVCTQTVVCERFTISEHTLRKTRQPDALYVIGFLMGYAELEGYEVELSPTSAKAFATDDKLKAYGWWVPGQRHNNDARRHLMVWLLKHKAIAL